MRIGFTIIYNGLHHLKHNDYAERLASILDHWIIIEGAAHPNGSTSWCKELPSNSSTDGTIEFLEEFEYKKKNVTTVTGRPQGWNSKDEMVNAAATLARIICDGYKETNFLWQIDIDEQWTKQQIEEAEIMLLGSGGDCGCFHANYFVGKNLVAKGVWGEGNDPEDPLKSAYRRLWKWNGNDFKTHEPPELVGGNGKEVLLPQKFDHFSYYFYEDVVFKSMYYNGYEEICQKWIAIQVECKFPQPVSRLIGGYWGKTKTIIERT